MIYLTSDTHFFHSNIKKFNPERPGNNIMEMNLELIRRWNQKVNTDDDIYHLGDFAFTGSSGWNYLLDHLNGRIHLILGNHDKKCGGSSKSRFASISPYLEINYNKTKITLCHYSMRVWNGSHRGSISFYGHSHGKLPYLINSWDVGVDNNDYYPLSIDEAIEKARNGK